MRLDDYDKGIRVEDQGSGRRGGMVRRGGAVGIGGIVIALVAALVFGVDPSQTLQVVEGMGGGGAPAADPAPASQDTDAICTENARQKFSCDTLSSLDATWGELFRAQGAQYQRPLLSFYDGAGRSGCGGAQAAMGPFYCPADNGIYLDTSFFGELEQKFGAAGDFAAAYVIAHEMGHHIQTLTGTSNQVRAAQQRAGKAEQNALQVRMELQADCYAGVWAARNRERIEPGDVEEGLTAAQAIGDDTLMRAAGRRVVPESFTHGSSKQRMNWLKRGLDSGDPAQCDTFGGRV